MSRSVARVVTALLLLPAGFGAAETLYNKDGSSEANSRRRVVIDRHRGAVVLPYPPEERHTAEQLREAATQRWPAPNVWRVEMVRGCYSGKTLDYLNAISTSSRPGRLCV